MNVLQTRLPSLHFPEWVKEEEHIENDEQHHPCFLLLNDHVWMLSHSKESLRTMMNDLSTRADTLGFAAKH